MRRFRCAALPGPGQALHLDPETSHHLLRVTGIAPGEAVLLFDGTGLEALAVLEGAAEGRATLRQEAPAVRKAVPEVHLLVALSKHAAMDTVLRMATELGAAAIHPVITQRSVARGDRADRWQRIAASAAAQCGRADVPPVGAAQPLVACVEALPAHLERRVYCPGGPLRAPPQPPCALLLGPEGGLAPAEIDLACQHGFQVEGLGPWTLRADTAVAAALARVG